MTRVSRHLPELDLRTWRALLLLTASLVQRLMRERLVLRSMIWPTALTLITLVLTLLLMSFRTSAPRFVVDPSVPPSLVEAMEARNWEIFEGDPYSVMLEGRALAGTDGRTIWTRGAGPLTLELESLLREHHGAPWRPAAPARRPPSDGRSSGADLLCKILAVLFSLYGAVFGLGAVARDRDDGSLDSELSLPVPHWVPGMARWAAATVVTTTFYGLAVAAFHAIMGVSSPWSFFRHGFAAAGGSAAIGLMVVGGAGLKRGFSGPMSASLALVTGCMGLWWIAPELGRVLPIASVLAGGSGWAPSGAALALGLLSAAVFSVRSARV